ncbi:MAG: iron-containing alcohol dehydrogenase, partial [Oscillospiraceae bacterium]|nr:iron-containing alcohol dehydrogenase [Oscillospiraceae bacterium]
AVTRTLPPAVTATTGMDALTHAVEAYIGGSTTKETRRLARETVRLVFENLETAYRNGGDLTARKHMLHAAHIAGIAFSKSYVGYVHAVAHSLGGQYNTPHGLANAVLLPIGLELYGPCVYRKLWELGRSAGIVDEITPEQEGAAAFIAAIRELNGRLGIPAKLPEIRREDVPAMAAHAAREANPLYPVPRLMDAAELELFYEKAADWS